MTKLMRVFAAFATAFILLQPPVRSQTDYTILLKSGNLHPQPISRIASGAAASVSGSHILIQFEGPVTDATKEKLGTQGIHLLDYVPNFAWIAKVDRNIEQSDIDGGRIRWYGRIAPEQKLSSLITAGISQFARRGGDKVQFVVVLQKDENARDWAERFRGQYGAEIIGIEPSTNLIDLIAPDTAYPLLAETDAVLWIETAKPEPQEDNNSSRDNIGATIVQAAPYNLDGTGILVAEWDGGHVYAGHQDFGPRVSTFGSATITNHATHVAGTIIGDGTRSGGTYRGMAPVANILSFLWWGSASEAFTEYTQAINWNASTASNSWGYGVGDPATQSGCEGTLGNYYAENATLDNLVRGSGGRPINIVWSAGNERSTSSQYCGYIGWTYYTIGALATAKNIITVGAINSNNSTMTSFSSWGPTDDGRIKPDVVAPGCQTSSDGGVTSCGAGGGYITYCGTSMSAPAVSGVIALMTQQRRNLFGSDVLPSTVKGILVNTANDLGATGPDYMYGHGQVDAVKACTKIGIGDPSYVQGQISTSSVNQYDLTVPSGAARLRVTLVWDDPGGTAISGRDLKNDLDIVLVDPFGAEQNAWVLDPVSPSLPASKGLNRRDNVESAEIANPTPGLWKARVVGYDVPNGPQKYSLVFTPDSINTPGQQLAWAVFDNGNAAIPPGQTAPVEFWVSNVGGQLDSAHVVVTDTSGWLAANLDTTVVLSPFDSSHIVVSITVPGGLAAGVSDRVTCRSRSLSDTMITSVRSVTISAAAVYSINMSGPANDSVSSPTALNISYNVQNNSNASNSITVTPVNSAGWTITPASRLLSLGIGGSGQASFALLVPSDISHLTLNSVTTISSGNGGVKDTAEFTVTVINPVAAPALVAPDTLIYTKDRTIDFAWSGTADSFRLVVAADTGMHTPVISYGGLTTPSLTMPAADSLTDDLYYWGVRSFVGADSSSFQRFPRRFVIDNVNPVSPTHISPQYRAILTQKNVTFFFILPNPPGSNEAPEHTRIRIATDSGFTTNLQFFDPVNVTTFPIPDTLAEGRWYWQAQRVDLVGNASQLPYQPNFLIDTKPPDLPTQIAPADSQIITTGTSVMLHWIGGPSLPYETSKEYYYLHLSKNSTFTEYSFTGYIQADSFEVAPPLLLNGQRYYWRLKALDSAGFYTPYTAGMNFLFQSYICGDVDGSRGVPDLSDLSYLVAYLTGQQPPPPAVQAASLDCNSIIDLTDLSTLVAYLTGTGVSLCCPQ